MILFVDGLKQTIYMKISDGYESRAITIPRLEVLQLRDWLNEWLARTPP